MKTRLTKKQKSALWGLIKYPSFNDRETADKIKMKLSTLTTIRYKMLNEKYYKTVNVPIVNRMAFEICAFFILRLAQTGKAKPINIRKGDFPNLVYIAHDQNRLLAFGFYPDYTSAEADLHALVSRLSKAKAIVKSGHWSKIMPLQNYDIPMYFEMSNFVNKGLSLNKQDAITTKGSIFKGDTIHLSSFERKVMRELVAIPDETDVRISKNLGITRSTVARIRERLLALAYKTLNIVDLTTLGYKAISIAAPTLYYTYSGPRSALLKAATSIETPLMLAVGDYGAVYMTAHKELKGIRSTTNNVFRSGGFKNHILDPSHVATFNLKHLNVLRNHEYLALTEQMLDRYEYRPKKRKKTKRKK